MLSSQLKEARRQRDADRKQLDAKVEESVAASEAVTEELWRRVNEAGYKVYDSEKLVERDLKTLDSAMRQFQQQTRQWLSLVHGLADELKPLGDVTNWLERLEEGLVEVAQDVDVLTRGAEDSGDKGSS